VKQKIRSPSKKDIKTIVPFFNDSEMEREKINQNLTDKLKEEKPLSKLFSVIVMSILL